MLDGLRKAQDIIERFAPDGYYVETYRAWERGHLPALCERLGDMEPSSVLDVGPGWGTLAVWLATQGWEVSVIDGVRQGRYLTAALCAEHRITYHRVHVEFAALDQEFPLVIMTQVLPHLRWQPQDALANVAAMMKPGGIYICSVLDKRCYPGTVPHYAHWRDVPRRGDGVPPRPESENCMYLAEDLRELLEGAFRAVRLWQPDSCTTIFAECRR